MTLFNTLKATMMLLGIILLVFMILVLAEFLLFALLDKLDERKRRGSK